VLIAALSTNHKIGLLVAALIFIVFSLVSSFVAPRYKPDFPGKGLTAFVVASIALFVLMLASVVVFGVEPKEHKAGAAQGHARGSLSKPAA
jgi:bacteriorhodopsin